MEFQQPEASLYVPDGRPAESALARTTHLGIGAHHDDLEIMALHGVLDCFDRDDVWFGGVICTDGAGSPRTGAYAAYSDEEMIAVRRTEQEHAARIGRYGFAAQLAWPSESIKQGPNPRFVAELRDLLDATSPDVVYTHNPADKHDTHVAVVAAVLEAARALPARSRPARMWGCEVWRDLDWLPDETKVMLDVSAHDGLAEKLIGAFASQIAGGKRYDLAAAGRRRANATFLQTHETDAATETCFAMDLTPLLEDDTLDPTSFTTAHIDRFRDDVEKRLRGA